MFFNYMFLLFQSTASSGTCFICLLGWFLLPFLLGLGIGYWIWARYRQLASDRENQVLRLKAQATEDEKARIELSQKLDNSNSIHTKLQDSLAECSAEKAHLNRQLQKARKVVIPPPVNVVDQIATETIEEEVIEEIVEAPEEVEPIVEIKEEVVEVPKATAITTPLAVASTGAVAAVVAKEKDKEDDYLPCKAYEGHRVNDKKNNIAFFKYGNGQYYFVLYNKVGNVRLRSEGFKTAKERDKELSGVIRLKDKSEFYKRASKGKYFMDVLYDESGREVGRSCLQKEPVKEEATTQIVEQEAVIEQETAVVKEVQKIAVQEPEVVERKIVRVKRTVNISGLEDLDGIDVAAQTRLINMGYPSMTTLAAADEATLTRRFAGTGLNWRYWWIQSKYAASGDWAKYYAYRDANGNLEVEDKIASTEPIALKKAVKVIPTTSGTVASSHQTSYGSYFSNNDLQIIEGVGPKLQSVLNKAGYSNWEDIADSSYDDLKRMLSNAGPRFRIHDPRSWARQAQLADEGKWEDLVAYQKFISQSTVGTESYSKVEKMMNRHLGFTNANPTDLKIVEGIGPKIEALLKGANINNWEDLSRATNDKLKLVLQNAGSRFRLADPATWPTQAGMAVRQEWTKLKEYQEMLQGGKDYS